MRVSEYMGIATLFLSIFYFILGKYIFTSQGLVLLLLINALTPWVPQAGDMQINRSDQPLLPKEVVRKVTFKMQPLLYS